jgi:ABC-type branched-subunit amino acid transport system substrate-binding protein
MKLWLGVLLLLGSCAGLDQGGGKHVERTEQKVIPARGTTQFQEIFFAARQKIEDEKFNEAKPLLEQYIRKAPGGMHVDQSQLFLGQLALREKKYDVAENYFNRIVSKAPISHLMNLARYYRARVWEIQGKKTEALADLTLINDKEGVFPDAEKLKMFLFWGKLARDGKLFRDSALAYRRAYHLGEDLKNPAGTTEARLQLESLIETDMTLEDLENFLRFADTRSVPGAMAAKRYEQLRSKTDQAVSTDQTYVPLNQVAIQDISSVSETFGEEGKVGLLLPIDSAEKAWGKAIYEGMQLALKKSGSRLQLIVQNPGATVDSAKQAFERLTKESKVMVVVGPLPGDQAQAVAKLASDEGVPFFSTSPRTSPAWGATTINFSFDFKKQSEALAKFASEVLNATRYAMLFPRDDFGKGFAESFNESVLRRGAKFTAMESFPVGQSDFRKNVENMVGLGNMIHTRWAERDDRLKELEAKVNRPLKDKEKKDVTLPPIVDFDVLFIPDSFKVIGQVAPLLAYYDIEGITLLGPSTWNSPQVLQRAGQFLEDAVVVDFFSKSSPNEVVRDFLRNFEGEYGKVPGALAALGFDLASSLDRAMKNASSSRKSLLKNFLAMGDYVGVIGLEKWDEKRDPIAELQVFRIRKSAIVWQQSIRIR